MENKFEIKGCWSFQDETISLRKAREECKVCSSKNCKRRVPQR